ncbi:hypothetical protein FHP25_07150 [Vineibacter terrae]|uniref:Uncharacterized protein n=1 Tax=Vineibacter terrae TaxID=2586908 RepID=A0A5C8PRG8_9HYPH|nr:hypothetical protein [Vineibacter terrae]TXL78764.1 hypothetical protein FHP25_07150 [Vineibacter terrae]
MSEYQYYEFRAIDRPLDAAAQAALRKISSRGEISAHGFVNSYQWGDFKGEPRRLMADWFDLFIHWTNWGTRSLMLRVPRRYLDPIAVKPYVVKGVVEAWTAGDNTIIAFDRSPEEDLDPFLEDEAGMAQSMIALRDSVLRGDLRLLYLGWLIAVLDGHVDDGRPEPPCPAGLGTLSGPLKALADFFMLDQDLVAAAAEGSTDDKPDQVEPSTAELSAFIETLPDRDKTVFLRRAVLEGDSHVRIDIVRRWAQAADGLTTVATPADRPQRRARDLLAGAQAQAQRRAQREAAMEAQRQEQARRALAKRLDALALRVEAAWQDVEAHIGTKQPEAYDKAVALLQDLGQLADRDGDRAAFDRHLKDLLNRHQGKTSFQNRLHKAGLKGKRA